MGFMIGGKQKKKEIFHLLMIATLTLLSSVIRLPFSCPRGSYFTGQRCQACFTEQCYCHDPFGCDGVLCASN